MSQPAVKYTVTVMARALLVQCRIPLGYQGMTTAQATRLNLVIASAATLIEHERDRLAAELVAAGLCPDCGYATHPEGQGCP